MRKIVASLILVSFLAVPIVGLAETAPTVTVMGALGRITNWLFAILLVAAVIFLILGGFEFLTAGGDPDKVKKAQDKLVYALVGVGVAVLAKGLVKLVQTIVAG